MPLTREVLCPMEGRKALDEIDRLLRYIDPREHVQDGAHELPRPGHGPLVTTKLPPLLDLIFIIRSARPAL